MAVKIKNIKLFIKEYIIYNLQGIVRYCFRSPNYKELYKLKDMHKGKRCFIVATGPSLKIEDAEKLKSEISFSLNSIFLAAEKTDWRSTYYVCLDERHFQNMLKRYPEQINKISKSYKFFNKKSKDVVKKSKIQIDNALYVPVSGINTLTETKKNKHFYFRKDLVRGMYNSGTVTNAAIIIAMYMGFKEIYLLGVDCNYKGKEKHFGTDWNDKTMSLSEEELIELRMRNGFRYIKKMADKNDVLIYNATRGGMLEDFPRVNFDDIVF